MNEKTRRWGSKPSADDERGEARAGRLRRRRGDAEGDSETHCRGCSSLLDEEAAGIGMCWCGSGLRCETMSRRREKTEERGKFQVDLV
jgi:hypothetical protein